MYPKAVPEQYLPHLLQLAYEYMKVLDLNAFVMMDESQGEEVVGNMNLPQRVVDAYFQYMPGAIGFVNGYAPSFTFARNGTRPFLSYDYYLSPDRSIAAAVEDLKELARLNAVRPYFMVIHVREFSNILRVKSIVDQLGPGYSIVHTDVLLKAAGTNPTFTTRYESDPQ